MAWEMSLGIGAVVGLAVFGVASRWPRLVSRRSSPEVAVVLIAAVVGAQFSPPTSTGLVVVDHIYAAAFAAIGTLAGARARRWTLIAASVVVAVGTGGTALVVAAGAALGLSTAMRLTGVRGSVAGSVVGAIVADVGLRLSWPTLNGVTTAEALLAVGLLSWSAYPMMHRVNRRRLGWIAAAGGGIAVVATALGVASLLEARGPALNGLAAAQSGLASAKAGDTAAASADLSSATADMDTVVGDLHAWWNGLARMVPVVSQNFHAIRVVAGQGQNVAASARGLLTSASDQALRPVNATFDLRALDRLQPVTEHGAAVADAALAEMSRLRSGWLLGALTSRIGHLRQQLGTISQQETDLAAATRILPDMLGGSGTRRYLVVFLDTAENRGGGGLATGYAQLDAADGHVTLSRLGAAGAYSVDHLTIPPKGAVISGPSDYLERYGQWDQGYFFINTFMSPDFVSDAEVAAQVYPQDGGVPVDGVIGVDPYGLSALLALSGPITDPDWPVPITSANVAKVVLHDEYERFSQPNQNEKRVQFLVNVGHETYEAATTRHLPGPAALGAELAPAVAQHHIQLWSSRPAEEALFDRIRASGRMTRYANNDFVEAVTMNGSNDKSDWYLHRSLSYDALDEPTSGAASAVATLRLTNDEPASGEPSYVIGGGPTFPYPAGVSEQYVELYTAMTVTAVSSPARLDDKTNDTDVGRHVYSLFVAILPGQTVTITYQLQGAVAPGPYRLDIGRQPAVFADHVDVRVTNIDTNQTKTSTFDLDRNAKLAF